MDSCNICDVCGRQFRTRRGLAGHLRHHTDPEHIAFKHHLKEYQATLRCRKCGALWVVRDRGQASSKRCPQCEELYQTLSRRAYEAYHPIKVPDVRHGARKSRWRPGSRRVQWVPGDALYVRVVEAMDRGDRVKDTLRTLGITYKVFRAIGEHAKGVQGYQEWGRARKAIVARQANAAMVRKYQELSPEAKAARMQRLFGGTCALEAALAEQLQACGVTGIQMNTWQTLRVAGKEAPREADIKVALPDGRKLVVLCDGEAFHGPRSIFDPENRVADDVATANAYFDLGYSVIRYSESEIKEGFALGHLCAVLDRLAVSGQVCRTWHPAQETWV